MSKKRKLFRITMFIVQIPLWGFALVAFLSGWPEDTDLECQEHKRDSLWLPARATVEILSIPVFLILAVWWAAKDAINDRRSKPVSSYGAD